MTSFNAVADLELRHELGPVVKDRAHVIRWLCADGLWFDGRITGFSFAVCTDHADPDDCPDGCLAPVAKYGAVIVTADLEDDE